MTNRKPLDPTPPPKAAPTPHPRLMKTERAKKPSREALPMRKHHARSRARKIRAKKSKEKKRSKKSDKRRPPPDCEWRGLNRGQTVLEGIGSYEEKILDFRINNGAEQARVERENKAWSTGWSDLSNLTPKIMSSPKRKRENNALSLPGKRNKTSPKRKKSAREPEGVTTPGHPQ